MMLLTESQRDTWNKRLLEVIISSDSYFPLIPGSKIYNPANDRILVPWGAMSHWEPDCYRLFDFVLRQGSDHAATQNELAMRDLLGLEYTITPVNESKEAKQVAKIFEDWLKFGLETDFWKVQEQLWYAITHGFVVHAPIWGSFQGYNFPLEFQRLEPWQFGWMLNDKGQSEMRFMPLNVVPGESVNSDEVWTCRYKSMDPTRPYGNGLINLCYKSIYELDWLNGIALEYAERYGKPYAVMKGSIKDQAKFQRVIDDAGGGIIMIKLFDEALKPDPALLNMPVFQFYETGRTTWDNFGALLQYKQEVIGRVFMGSTLTSMVNVEGREMRGSSTVHQKTTSNLTDGRARWYEGECWNPIFKRIVANNPKFKGLCPRIKIVTTEESKDRVAQATVIDMLAKTFGMKFKGSDLREVSETTSPELGDEVFTAISQDPPTPPVPAQSAGQGMSLVIDNSNPLYQKRMDAIDSAITAFTGNSGRNVLKPIASWIARNKGKRDFRQRLQDLFSNLKAKNLGQLKKDFGIDLTRFSDAIYQVMINGFGRGWLDAESDLSTGQKFAIDSVDTFLDAIQAPTEAANAFRERAKIILTPEEWQEVTARMHQDSIGFAYAGCEKITQQLIIELDNSLVQGLDKEQFIARINHFIDTNGLATSLPVGFTNPYLSTVYTTVLSKSYSDAQDVLVASPGGQSVAWGYQWHIIPGYNHHDWHTEDAMDNFAAPVDHPAWNQYGWYMGGAYNCRCYRQIISWFTSIARGWAMKDKATGQLITLKPEPVKPFNTAWVNQFAAGE